VNAGDCARGYRTVFAPSTRRERAENFQDYWRYTQAHDGDILEAEQDLTVKQAILARFRERAVRSRRPLADPEAFYRNYVRMRDDPAALDPTTRFLTFLYKFARHEWVGISAAWGVIPSMAEATRTTDWISRYHLCEEFCHIRLFSEMFRTFHLDRVKWVPLGPWMARVYRTFPRLPEAVMAGPAFVSELMGLTLYVQIDRLLGELLRDEPEAQARVRALLREIMADEAAHVGQRRNFLGPAGIRAARRMVAPMYRLFFRDIPETKYLFDVDQMVREGLAFDYGIVPPEVLARSWVPSYCRT
jgi:hypothetical protein